MIGTILHILLIILKIIGITLGILIGIILLGLCLVLFVPMRYRIELERKEEEGSPPIVIRALVTWLLHFVNARVLYSTELNLRLKLLCFTIFRIPAKPKKSRRLKESKKNKNNKNNKNNSKSEEKKNNEYASKAEKLGNGNDDYMGQSKEDLDDTEQKLSIKDKLIKLQEFFNNIRYTIIEMCDRIKRTSENLEYYKDILEGDMFKASFGLCKGELLSILSYIKPREIKAELTIGTGDPAATGQIISYYYAILYPYFGSDVTLIGDFDNKRIEGTAYIKGKVKLFTLIKAVLRIYFNKDIKNLLKLFKKEDE